ncbi:MAG: hypothetical protein RMK84_19655 [Oscillochloridaceae bacterium]|nr:hypothetical protein [Chloroflexaceae bacterium]MDW8392339.1 hypothetical protein [Oscillochloridaceae bacterium]
MLYRRATLVVMVALLVMMTGLTLPVAMAQSKGEGGPAPAQAPGQTINGTPLTVRVLDNLAMAVNFDGRRQFFADTDGGTFVQVDGIVYGSTPAAGGGFAPRPFTPVSNSPVTGSGTAADPFRIATEVEAGTSGVRVSQVTTYVNGERRYRVDITARNTSSANRNVRIFHGADLFLNFPGNVLDFGFGFFDPPTGAVGALSQDQRSVQVFIPITAPTAYQEAFYATFWSRIGGANGAPGPGFDNTINSSFHDTAAGLQYDRTLAPGASETVSLFGAFGLADDVGIRPPALELPPEPADVWVVIRPSFNLSVAPRSIIVFEIVITNIGRGAASSTEIIFPFDPDLLQVVDASFDVPTTWVAAVNRDSLVIRSGLLGPRSGRTRGTIRFTVRENARQGGTITGRVQLRWTDGGRGGRSQSNLFVIPVGPTAQSSPTYVIVVEPAAGSSGAVFRFTSPIFVPREPVGVWYNLPDGRVVAVNTLRANDEGALTVNFTSRDLPPGTYSMVFYGLWSEFTAVTPFVIR